MLILASLLLDSGEDLAVVAATPVAGVGTFSESDNVAGAAMAPVDGTAGVADATEAIGGAGGAVPQVSGAASVVEDLERVAAAASAPIGTSGTVAEEVEQIAADGGFRIPAVVMGSRAACSRRCGRIVAAASASRRASVEAPVRTVAITKCGRPAA
jgi:hypothetical protein